MKKFAFAAALIACAAIMVSLASAQASSQRITPDESKRIQPTGIHVLPNAVERTMEQMDAFEATYMAPGEREEPAPRPTIDANVYAQMKRAAQLAPYMAKPSASSPELLAPKVTTKFVGATECDGPGGCWLPPDVAGAIGKSNYVSVSNDEIEFRSRGGAVQKITSLNAFFGYSTESMFDPRVQYDETYQRFVVTCLGFQESTTVQYLGIAVSQTNNPMGKWWIFFDNVTPIVGTGGFYDFDMLGMNQDALLFTANLFGATQFEGSSLFAVAKARLYNGFGYGVPYWTGLVATLQPNHTTLFDQNGYAWLAAAPGGSGNIYMYAMGYPASPQDTGVYGYYTVSGVAAYSVPPGAPQPASCAPAGALLDSLDNRFQNVGVQDGDVFYQTHAIALGSYTANRYYVITGLDSFAPTVAAQNIFYASGSSNDWNPSVAADPAGHFALNWSYTDTSVLASERYADNSAGNPFGATGINVFTSASCYTGVGTSRWGDYSSTGLDPGTGATSSSTTKIFWIDNETIPSANFWSTEIAKITY